jgi:hypothetical protein
LWSAASVAFPNQPPQRCNLTEGIPHCACSRTGGLVRQQKLSTSPSIVSKARRGPKHGTEAFALIGEVVLSRYCVTPESSRSALWEGRTYLLFLTPFTGGELRLSQALGQTQFNPSLGPRSGFEDGRIANLPLLGYKPCRPLQRLSAVVSRSPRTREPR